MKHLHQAYRTIAIVCSNDSGWQASGCKRVNNNQAVTQSMAQQTEHNFLGSTTAAAAQSSRRRITSTVDTVSQQRQQQS